MDTGLRADWRVAGTVGDRRSRSDHRAVTHARRPPQTRLGRGVDCAVSAMSSAIAVYGMPLKLAVISVAAGVSLSDRVDCVRVDHAVSPARSIPASSDHQRHRRRPDRRSPPAGDVHRLLVLAFIEGAAWFGRRSLCRAPCSPDSASRRSTRPASVFCEHRTGAFGSIGFVCDARERDRRLPGDGVERGWSAACAR